MYFDVYSENADSFKSYTLVIRVIHFSLIFVRNLNRAVGVICFLTFSNRSAVLFYQLLFMNSSEQ